MSRPDPPLDPTLLGYRPALDGVRALAVSLVLAFHAASYLLSPAAASRWVPGGFLGVDLFFVLSGFLITTLLLEEHQRRGAISLKSFYARRALRLLPAVGVLLVAEMITAILTRGDLGLEARSATAVALYGVNWALVAGWSFAGRLGHLWSLSVEEQFYLLWPAFLLLAMRHRRRTTIIVTCAIVGIVAATGLRAWLWSHGADWLSVYVRTDARADELLMGVLLAVAFRQGWRLPYRLRHVGIGAVAVLLLCATKVHVNGDWLYVRGGFTIVGLASVLLIASVLDVRTPLARAFAWRPAVSLGRASYSLYLWHAPVFIVVATQLADRPAAQRLLVGAVVCAVASMASYGLVEAPARRLRRKAQWAAS